MDKKSKLKTELAKKLKQETSGTGTGASVTPGVGAGVATKYAFGKRKNKGTPSDWKDAPSIPNRPSKAMDYKELWEDNSNLNPAIQNLIDYMIQNKVQKKIVKLKADSKYDEFIKDAKPAIDQKILRVTLNPIDKNEMWISLGSEAQKLFKEFKNTTSTGLNENYSRFKIETKTRGKSDQFHQAVKQVKKKMNEINRIFEYVERLKSELSEGEDLKYKKYTENAFAQIKESAKQLFLKSTKLK